MKRRCAGEEAQEQELITGQCVLHEVGWGGKRTSSVKGTP